MPESAQTFLRFPPETGCWHPFFSPSRRGQQSLKRTFERRPELLEQEEVQANLTKKDREYLDALENPEEE